MTDWTPKNNRIPWGLLTADEQNAMQECGGPWEVYIITFKRWDRIVSPAWAEASIYRQAPHTPISIAPETLAVLPDWAQWMGKYILTRL